MPSGDWNDWEAVDRWFTDRLLGDDPVLDAVEAAAEAAGLPAHHISPLQGRFLQVLALGCGARSILEIGTLAGYSTVWLARAVPRDGRVVTIEIDPDRAALACANLQRAGLGTVVDVRTGDAMVTMAELDGTFDLVFVDADKRVAADHVGAALALSRPGTVIVVDNVVRNDPTRLVERLAHEPRLAATAIQTVGEKGRDGFLLAVVIS